MNRMIRQKISKNIEDNNISNQFNLNLYITQLDNSRIHAILKWTWKIFQP